MLLVQLLYYYSWLFSLFITMGVAHDIGSSRDPNAGTGQQPRGGGGFSAAFIFGDSLLDPGNDAYLSRNTKGADHAPYGRDLPDGRPGKFSNGLIASDVIASLAKLPFPPAYLANPRDILKGTSFAIAGAVINNKTGNYPFPRLNFDDQVRLFSGVHTQLVTRLGQEQASGLVSTALFAFCFGSNDYITNYFGNPLGQSKAQRLFTPKAFIDHLISSYKQQLVNLYALGARKFALISIPPVGCMPFELLLAKTRNRNTCVSYINQEVRNFNVELLALTVELQVTFRDAHFVYLNAYDVTMDAITHPSKYGFVYGLKPCCSTGPYGGVPLCNEVLSTICEDASQHVFWDFAHPTQSTNVLVANRLWTGAQPDVYPINLQELSLV